MEKWVQYNWFQQPPFRLHRVRIDFFEADVALFFPYRPVGIVRVPVESLKHPRLGRYVLAKAQEHLLLDLWRSGDDVFEIPRHALNAEDRSHGQTQDDLLEKLIGVEDCLASRICCQ